MKDLLEHYAKSDEDRRLLKSYATKLEYDTTMYCLTRFLDTPLSITELGAGTGRYSLYLADNGHDVTAVEVVPEYVKIIKKKAIANKLKLNIHESNAVSVPFIPTASQDIVLILGPLYHLQRLEERIQMLTEAKRILKKDGIVVIAYINKFFVGNALFQMEFEPVSESILNELVNEGIITNPESDSFIKIGYFSSPDEMENLMRDSGFEINDHVATDGIGRFILNERNFTDNDITYKKYRDFHFKTCREKSILGMSNHGLIIGRK